MDLRVFLPNTVRDQKFKLNDSEKELIGVQDAILFWASNAGVDNSTDDDGNSGLHLTTFDVTSRADSAKILLLNDSGSSKSVVAAAIKAKPIIRLSGEQGFLHDSFIDYQDIFLNGENTYEFGNNFVVTKAQLEKLADYWAKAFGVISTSGNPKTKHLYGVTIPGRRWDFEPGEWYTLQVGGAGQREYINSTVECYAVAIEAPADELGVTNITFREVEQNWVKDSNAVARFLATGDPRWKPNNFGRVVVGAKDYLGVADYYCDGVDDDVEIQAAIDYVTSSGGGLVDLTEGQFNITATIIGKENIILSGAGSETIIDKNVDGYAIEFIGTSDVYLSNFTLRNCNIRKNVLDEYITDPILVYFQYAEKCLIENNYISDSMTYGIQLVTCRDFNIVKNHVYNNGSIGIGISSSSNRNNIVGNIVWGNSYGITIRGENNLIQGNQYFGNGYGIYTYESSRNEIANNVCTENYAFGIHLASSDAVGNRIMSNVCINNGNLLDRSNCENATPPAIDGEVANTLTQCTYARNATQKYEGSYSYLLTKTVAAGTAATAYLTDNANTNDLHGLFAEQEYRFGCWVYIPSGGMLGSELSLVIRDYVAAWEEGVQVCANTYDTWQYVEVTKTLRAGSLGATFGFSIASAAANGETAYTDNLRLTPMGMGNLHNQNFYDAGTNTYTGV